MAVDRCLHAGGCQSLKYILSIIFIYYKREAEPELGRRASPVSAPERGLPCPQCNTPNPSPPISIFARFQVASAPRLRISASLPIYLLRPSLRSRPPLP